MNLVDSCGWLEYFADGGNASFFAPAIEDMDRLIVPSLCPCSRCSNAFSSSAASKMRYVRQPSCGRHGLSI